MFYVKATDLDGNAATYIKKFTIAEPTIVTAKLEGSDNGVRDDRLKVVAGTATAAGAAVKVFKITDNGNRVFLRGATLGDYGNVRVVIPDKNGREYTKYVAKVEPTAKSTMDWTNNLRVR